MASYCLLINPISGTRKKAKRKIIPLLEELLVSEGHELDIRETAKAGDARRIAQNAVQRDVDVLIVAGGDGTINEVIPMLYKSKTSLAIIPMGSGNGIARCLNIPLNIEKAARLAISSKPRSVDIGRFGEHFFMGVAGMGFDAHIARSFREESRRGLMKYAWLVCRECLRFKPFKVTLQVNGKLIEEKAFILTAANANQYGNNAYVDKAARMDDGLMNLVVLRSLPLYLLPLMIMRGFLGTVPKSKYAERYMCNSFSVESEQELAHVDGEPIKAQLKNEVRLDPASLLVNY